MTAVAIEINDIGLEAAAGSGLVGAPSPGYVLLDRRRIIAGGAASSESRLRPRFVSHRHWDLLSRESAGRPFPRGLSQADLVHAHLTQYWEALLLALETTTARTSVLLAVPGCYSVDQLSLLLGITRAADIPVTGMVDSALAAIAIAAIDGPILHLDIRLHRAVWTVLEVTGQISRTQAVSVEAAGLQSFRQAWVRLVAERFVRETRLDPLHQGATEQMLYDQLDDWAMTVEKAGAAPISIGAAEQVRTVEISSEHLASAAGSVLDALVKPAAGLLAERGTKAIHVSSRLAGIPGLSTRLAEVAGGDPVQLPAGAAVRGALERRESIDAPGSALRLITGLPVQPAATFEPHG
jgi:hypothetical protein